jgi:hypothetical protein
MLDGNAVAGLLQEVFAVEMTTAIGTCNTCGMTDQVGRFTSFVAPESSCAARTATTHPSRSSKTAHACGSASREAARFKSPFSRAEFARLPAVARDRYVLARNRSMFG